MATPHPDSDGPDVISYELARIELHASISGDAYTLGFVDDGREVKWMTADRTLVNACIRRLIDEADLYTTCAKGWVPSTSDAQRRDDLAPLIVAADELGTMLLPCKKGARLITKLKGTSIEQVLVVAVGVKELNFPWNLIRPPGGGWLGELACFCLPRVGEDGLRDIAEDRDKFGVVAGYADDDELMSGRPSTTLPNATESELHALRQLAGTGVDILDDLPAGPLNQQGLDQMREWLSRPLHLFHFNCHAKDLKDSEGYTGIGLRIGARASGRDVLGVRKLTGAVVLDVCAAAQGREGHWERCFSACLHDSGVPGVCAPSCTVTDAFGTRFSEELYRQVPLNDYNLLRAVRATQRVLLEEWGDPMALYYTYEGSPRFEIGKY